MAETSLTPVLSNGAAYLTLQMLEGLSRPGEESWWERHDRVRPSGVKNRDKLRKPRRVGRRCEPGMDDWRLDWQLRGGIKCESR